MPPATPPITTTARNLSIATLECIEVARYILWLVAGFTIVYAGFFNRAIVSGEAGSASLPSFILSGVSLVLYYGRCLRLVLDRGLAAVAMNMRTQTTWGTVLVALLNLFFGYRFMVLTMERGLDYAFFAAYLHGRNLVF